MLIEELYDALIEAGASEAKAKAAARAIADYEKRLVESKEKWRASGLTFERN